MADEIKLELFGEDATEVGGAPVTAAPARSPAENIEESLSEHEREMVSAFAEKIDVSSSAMVLNYGAAAQTKLSTFSESALSSVRTKEMGEIGDRIADLVGELRGFDVGEQKGFLGLFRRARGRVETLKAQYAKAETNVEKIVAVLEGHQTRLLKDIATLDELYAQNLQNFKELGMYILAGREKLAVLKQETLPALQARAEASGLPEDAQAARDMANYIERFEKKVHDLELTRTVSLQMAPQIRLVQNTDSVMAEKIQSTVVNTVPLWKSQMVLALGIAHSGEAMEAQRAVTDMTNDLLRRNAEMLHEATVGTARESERGIVDIETLQNTNRMLITTLDEVMQIQQEGREKRAAAETELGRIEGELKQKLLELRG